MQAFRALDPENLGYVTVAKMKDLLTTRGTTPFREAEVDGRFSSSSSRRAVVMEITMVNLLGNRLFTTKSCSA